MANPDIIISPGNGSIGFSGSLAGDSNSSKLLVGSNGDLHMRGSDMFISGNLTVSGDITSSSASHQATSYTASTHVSGLSGYFGKVGIGTTNLGAAPDALTVGALVAGNTKTVQFNSEGGTEIGLKVMSRTNRAVLKVGDNDTNSYIASENSTSSFGPAAELSSNNINLFGGGKVGIGTILSNGALLTVNGDASISGELKTKTPLKVEAASPTSNAHYFRMSYDNSVGILDANRGKLRLQANDGVIYTDGDSIGIGTSNPSSTLHLKKSSGTTTVLAEVAANSTIGFEIKKTGSTTQHWKIVDGQTVNGRLEFYDATDSATRMIIDGDGNVGIGTISPSSRLQIFGNSAGTAKLQIEGESGADPYINFLVNNTTHWAVGADDNRGDCFKISQHSALGTNDFFAVRTDGKVGIGTDDPTYNLSVVGAGSQILEVNSTNSHASIIADRHSTSADANFILATNGANKWRLAIMDADDTLQIYDDINDSVTTVFKAGGNAGIGTTVPSGRLHVENNNTGIIVANDQITGNAFEVFGAQGNLLTVTDDLSDSLFSVNDAAGMPVFEVFADDTIKSYRNNESKFEVDPDNNRIRLRDNVNISGLTTITGGAVVGGGTRFTAGGTHELSINLGVGDCIGIGASDSALNYFRRYSAINETLQLQTYAGANNGIFSMQPYGGEVHIGTNNGTTRLGSLLAVDGDAQISGHIRAGADGKDGMRMGHWEPADGYGYLQNEALDPSNGDNYAVLQQNNGTTYINAGDGRKLYLRVENATEYDSEFSVTGVLFNRGGLPNADFAIKGDNNNVFKVDAGDEYVDLQTAKLKIAGVATANKYLKCTNADGTISWEDAAGGGGAVSAVANGSDNRIATFSSSDALNGEANLTFDGTTLNIQQARIKLAGSATANGYIKCTNSNGSVTFDTLSWDDLPAIDTLSTI